MVKKSDVVEDVVVSFRERLIPKATDFCVTAHKDQVRKYTGLPYATHPIAVSKLVETVTDNPYMIAAALLHDTVEDTDATLEQIEKEFGPIVCELVENLTDVSKPEDGNRAVRKNIDLEHTALALPAAKTIKLADLIDNAHSIVSRDPKFAAVYMVEKQALLEVLKEGDQRLYITAQGIVNDYFAEFGEPK